VCGILITNGSVTGFSDAGLRMAGPGDTHLLNPDGYSRWWNPAEFPTNLGTMFSYNDGAIGTPDSAADYNCTLNAYKYFADELGPTDPLANLSPAGRGVFTTGKKNIRHYKIELGNDGLIFNYAIDACWKMPKGSAPWDIPDDFGQEANRAEAYRISVVETQNSLHTGAGQLDLEIWVYDWFNPELNTVTIEAPGAIGPVTASAPVSTGDGYAIYTLQATNCTPPTYGNLDILVSVASEQTGYGGLLPGIPVTAYFIHTTYVPLGWARTWGGSKGDGGLGVALDGFGNIYITGFFRDTVDFDPGSGIDIHSSSGYEDLFLCKFDSSGEFNWARTWGGSESDEGCYEVVADDYGNIYVTGDFRGAIDFDPGPGIDEHSSNGNHDAFLSKFNSSGDFQWARTWGGPNEFSRGLSVAMDASGDIYVTGWFEGPVDFDPGNGTDVHSSIGDEDVFLSKFGANGDFLWARTWGGDIDQRGYGVATDSYGYVYVTGSFRDTVDFNPGDGIDIHIAMGANVDVFISKFNAYGEFQWALSWGGISNDIGYGIALDDSASIYVTGEFKDTVDFDPGPGIDEHQAHGWQGKSDIFLSKFGPTGDYQWAQTWGAIGWDNGCAVEVDPQGDIYVTGNFENTVDFDPGPGIDEHKGGPIFLSKFNPNGDFKWARTWGGNIYNWCRNIGLDGSGNVYATGGFQNTVDFDPGPGVDMHTSNGSSDVFLSKFPPDGNW
jgi:hypothetical protein